MKAFEISVMKIFSYVLLNLQKLMFLVQCIKCWMNTCAQNQSTIFVGSEISTS